MVKTDGRAATLSREHDRMEDTGVRNKKIIIILALDYMVIHHTPPFPQYTYNITKVYDKYFSGT